MSFRPSKLSPHDAMVSNRTKGQVLDEVRCNRSSADLIADLRDGENLNTVNTNGVRGTSTHEQQNRVTIMNRVIHGIGHSGVSLIALSDYGLANRTVATCPLENWNHARGGVQRATVWWNSKAF